MKIYSQHQLSILAALFLASGAPAVAQSTATAPMAGQWTVDVTTVATHAHFNTVGICLKSDGTWYSTVQRRGSGRWLVNGANLMWRGNYETGLNDAAVLNISSPRAMSGPLMQWVAGSTDKTNVVTENVFGVSAWRLTSASCDAPL